MIVKKSKYFKIDEDEKSEMVLVHPVILRYILVLLSKNIPPYFNDILKPSVEYIIAIINHVFPKHL